MSANAEALGTTRLLWRVITRFWSARALAEAGVGVSAWIAVVTGPVAIALMGGLLAHSAMWGIAEPYPDFGPLFLGPRQLFGLMLFGTAFFGAPLLLLAGAFALTSRRDDANVKRFKRAQSRIFLLLPLCALLPMLAWLPLNFLNGIASPNLGINSGKPAWTTWPGWRVAGSCFWLPLFVGLAVWQVCRAIAIADRHFRGEGCIGCGYTLEGLSSPVCPECGKTADR